MQNEFSKKLVFYDHSDFNIVFVYEFFWIINYFSQMHVTDKGHVYPREFSQSCGGHLKMCLMPEMTCSIPDLT